MAYYDSGVFSGIERETTATQFDKNGDGKLGKEEMGQMLSSAITYELEKAQRVAAERVVPWFFENMPDSYFKHIKRSEINRHLRAISSLTVTGEGDEHSSPSLTLLSDNEVTYVHSGDRPGLLHEIMDELSKKNPATTGRKPLQALKAFTAKDGSMMLDIFDFGRRQKFTGDTEDQQLGKSRILEYIDDLKSGKFAGEAGHASPDSELFDQDALDKYMEMCSADYVAISDPRRFCLQREMYDRVSGTEAVDILVDDDKDWGEGSKMVTIAATNMLPERFMQAIAVHLDAFQINIKRAHVDVVLEPGAHECDHINYDEHREFVVMCRLLVNATTELPSFDGQGQYEFQDVLQGLRRVKWLDDEALSLFHQHMPTLGIDCVLTAEVISALCNALRTPLSKVDRFAFAGWRLNSMVQSPENLPIACDIAHLLLARFNPENPMDEDEFLAKAAEIRATIDERISADDASTLLTGMVEMVTHVLRTNVHEPNRYALAFRIDPKVMHELADDDRPIPYGVFYVHGRRFDGFHVRFRDIARGGLRMVTPKQAAYEGESCRHYDEAYNLATAQQLKNKDIPEGGSKAVVLIRPSEISQQQILVRKCVKGFVDSMLDLLGGDDVQDRIVARNEVKDIVYLGPDEQIIPEDIAWMTQRATKRKYFNGNAFISSKAENGLNHKEFGVTSEGVNVFMEVALKRVGGIDPYTQPFTVKLTGGPDGDVAGNMIKIMHREYGDNVKVVGIADGFGAAEDPEGLDMQELLRLVAEEKAIDCYGEHDALLRGGSCLYWDISTQEGNEARNTLHNRVKADAFVPAGGRPDTIGEQSWRQFLDPETGKPSAGVIAEGANLYLTPPAREALFTEAGVMIVKDSSANKCGVMCSSYEIMAAMLMDKQEFVDNKPQIVEDVQAKLKELARTEANLLFDEYEKDPSCQLPALSLRISNAIIKVSDAVSAALDKMDDSELQSDKFGAILAEHLPDKLNEIGFDRLHDRVPPAYIRQIIAKRLGTKLVYTEGLDYCERLPESGTARMALGYIDAERDLKSLVDNAHSTDPDTQAAWKENVLKLLGEGSPRLILEARKSSN
jgi:glutamate dehydrogenase